MRRLKSLGLRVKLFRARRQLRELHRTHLEADKAHQALLSSNGDADTRDAAAEKSTQTAEVSVAKAREVEGLQAQINEIRTARLVRKLLRRGLDLPDSEWYTFVQASMPYGSRPVGSLTKYGESKVRRALKVDRRETWEFRFKVITPVLTGLTGLIGVFIGLLSSERLVPAFQRLIHWLFG